MQLIGKFCCLHEKCVYIFLPHFPDRLVESGSILALTKRLLTTITATPSPTTTLGKVTFAITSRYDARKENIIVHSLDVNQRPLIVGSVLFPFDHISRPLGFVKQTTRVSRAKLIVLATLPDQRYLVRRRKRTTRTALLKCSTGPLLSPQITSDSPQQTQQALGSCSPLPQVRSMIQAIT